MSFDCRMDFDCSYPGMIADLESTFRARVPESWPLRMATVIKVHPHARDLAHAPPLKMRAAVAQMGALAVKPLAWHWGGLRYAAANDFHSHDLARDFGRADSRCCSCAAAQNTVLRDPH